MSKPKFNKPKPMWAYITLNGKEVHAYTSEKAARGFWAEQGPSKRIKRVRIQIERSQKP